MWNTRDYSKIVKMWWRGNGEKSGFGTRGNGPIACRVTVTPGNVMGLACRDGIESGPQGGELRDRNGRE